MREIGDRLRERARALGLTDVDVARRLGLAQGRYSHYVNGNREPDLALFVRICRELETTPNDLLGFGGPADGAETPTRSRIGALMSALGQDGLEVVLGVVQVLARQAGKQDRSSGGEKPKATTAGLRPSKREGAGKGDGDRR